MCFNSKVTCWRVVHIEGRSVGRNPRVENLTTSIETEIFTSHNKIMSFFFFLFFFSHGCASFHMHWKILLAPVP